MFVADLLEDARSVVAIFPGRFHPFHKGHAYMYQQLVSRYGRDRSFIATSNKVEQPKSPFSFSDKAQMMRVAGIPADKIVETRNPYQAQEIVGNFDPTNTILIFAVSEKDMDEDPRFSFAPKKDGSPSYLQKLPDDLKNAKTLDQHGYITTLPTLDFTVLGEPMRSATELRAKYAAADDDTRKAIINDLYGTYSEDIKHIMDNKIGNNISTEVTEDWRKSLSTAAVALGVASAPATAHSSEILDAIVKLSRSYGNISQITKSGVEAEINQELKNQLRRDANSRNLRLQNRNDITPPTQNRWSDNATIKGSNESVREGVGRIVKGVNTTPDVGVNQVSIEAAKFGSKVDKDGRPPTLSKKVKGKSTNVAFNLGLTESLYKLDRDDPMNSEVLISGMGRYNIKTLHKNLAEKFKDLSERMASMSPDQAEQARYLLTKSPLIPMMNALQQAYDDLREIKRKGGVKSRGINL
jgi:hypothetical protein